MTKKKWLVLSIGIVLVGAAVLALYEWNRPVSLDFAETVTIRSTNEADWEAVVTDGADIQRLISICSQNEPWPLRDAEPGCPFDYELIFSGGSKTVRVRPACDDCNPLYINGRLRKMTKVNTDIKRELREILARYTDDTIS